MCKCTPNKRTPFCGAPGCEWPPQAAAKPAIEELEAILGQPNPQPIEITAAGEVVFKGLREHIEQAINRTRLANYAQEVERLSTLLAMVAVHLEHPELGGLSEEQRLAISEWYETFRERVGEPQPREHET